MALPKRLFGVILMKLLYSIILPLKVIEGQEGFMYYFFETMSQSDELDIAVGYVSKASLIELGDLVKQYGIKKSIFKYWHVLSRWHA
jgi:hypothetical protein